MDNRIDLDEKELGALSEVLEKLLQQDADALERRMLVFRFFRILSQGMVKQPATEVQRLPKVVADALDYMDRNLQNPIDVKMLAGVCNVSVNTLERYFKNSLHILPMEMLKQKRLYASMMYLKSGYTVSEAAAKSGFLDWSNYIQLFRKQFGITPGKYKKEVGNTKGKEGQN